ncbi:MAG: tRNA (guanosine(37)-N1)-methyltransferase TrmD [Clostridia bacterium]|nr:tRNA (guanosine(37)-N1)-methyltransferase TrmD [Clostridia bacterium]
MKIDVLTLFPEMFSPVTDASILGKAAKKEILEINIIDIRDYAKNKHKKTDDTPFGGGAGMVMSPQPVFDALKALNTSTKRLLYMSPRGKILNQALIQEFSAQNEIVILCGHYEGVDQRIIDAWNIEEISIGDYILTGGELAAMVLIDSVARFVDGVIGNERAHEEESIYSGLLEYDQYTKPREFEGFEVPQVLFNGNHKLIHLWQWENSLRLTKKKRPDLFCAFLQRDKILTKQELQILNKVAAEDTNLDEN